MVMTANGEVPAKEEATVYVRVDLFVTVMLLENTPAVLSLGKARNHISSRKARNFIATHQITYHWSYLVYPRDPPVHQLLSTSSSQETVTDTELPATRRSEKASEDSAARGNSWHESTEFENPKMTTRNYRVVSCKVCRIGHRSSSMNWLMKVLQNIEMLPVLLMNYLWSREQKWYRVNTTSCDICVWTKITRASCRRRHRYSRAHSRIFWWCNNCGSQSPESSVKDVSLDMITDTLWWYKTWLLSAYNLTHVKRKLLRKHKRAGRSSWSRPGNQK